jgi:23S rRNA pseudouridine2457 synthase
MLIGFYKPYGVLSQFSEEMPGQKTLANFNFPKKVYPIGRLDADSEGLLLLSDEKKWTEGLLHPKSHVSKIYWVQVEREPMLENLKKLEQGILIQGKATLPCRIKKIMSQPEMAERNPPIRFRKNVPTCWIEIELKEGKNRQVRRMTATIGHPTLRLIRIQIGELNLKEMDLGIGEWRELKSEERSVLEKYIRLNN